MRLIVQVICASFLVSLSAGTFAANAAEKEAAEAIQQYWQAVVDRDFETQAAMASSKGTLDANSDGSFFRQSPKVDAKQLESQTPGTASMRVFYPEATELSKGVVMVRYYLEGVIESPAGKVPNYRTRVTTVLVKESGGWKIRAWHFSPLHDGGRYLTQKTDFED